MNSIKVDEHQRSKSTLNAILFMSMVEALILTSVIWPPILVTIYDITLYYILILYLPLLFTIPIGMYVIYAKKVGILESGKPRRDQLNNGVKFYAVVEVIELLASLAGTITRIYYYSACSTSSDTTCRTVSNNAAALSLLILNILAMGVSSVSLLMIYMYSRSVQDIQVIPSRFTDQSWKSSDNRVILMTSPYDMDVE